jgi:hypothetical protein
VAQLLDRSPDGLRVTLRGSNPLGRQLCAARVKIGRRVHFKVRPIALLVDGELDDSRRSTIGATR